MKAQSIMLKQIFCVPFDKSDGGQTACRFSSYLVYRQGVNFIVPLLPGVISNVCIEIAY